MVCDLWGDETAWMCRDYGHRWVRTYEPTTGATTPCAVVDKIPVDTCERCGLAIRG